LSIAKSAGNDKISVKKIENEKICKNAGASSARPDVIFVGIKKKEGVEKKMKIQRGLTSIYRYNTTSGLFEKCDHFDNRGWWPATGSEIFTKLEPGRGYWAMAKNDCVWRHEA